MKVQLRNGEEAEIWKIPREDRCGVWEWLGKVRGETHCWRWGGNWKEDGAVHDLDIVRGLVIAPKE